MKELQKLAKEISEKHPELSEKINELLNNCYIEIDNGGAEIYEVEKCYDTIKRLVKKMK